MATKKQIDVRCSTCNSLLCKLDDKTILAGAVEIMCRKCKTLMRVEPDVKVVAAQFENGSGVK